MPVIGSLDGQVDEVIISPISRGRREVEAETPADPRREEPAAPPPPAAGRQTPRDGESSAGREELPVWLL